MSLFAQPVMQFVDIDGAPLAFGEASFTEASTTTPVDVYQDSGFVTPHVNPVIADSEGKWPPIYINPALGPVRCRVIPAGGSFASPLIDADPADSLFALGEVTNAYLADMAAGTVKSNLTGGSAPPVDNTLDDLTDALRVGSETEVGVLLLATTAEAAAGTDTAKAVTAAGVAAAIAGGIGPDTDLLAADGFVQFSNGLIIQWGQSAAPVDIDDFVDIVFPMAFTTACYNVQHSPSVPAPYSLRMDSWSLRVDPASTTGVRLYCASSANSQAITIDWFAIGK
jgi:hypothetical protein